MHRRGRGRFGFGLRVGGVGSFSGKNNFLKSKNSSYVSFLSLFDAQNNAWKTSCQKQWQMPLSARQGVIFLISTLMDVAKIPIRPALWKSIAGVSSFGETLHAWTVKPVLVLQKCIVTLCVHSVVKYKNVSLPQREKLYTFRLCFTRKKIMWDGSGDAQVCG